MGVSMAASSMAEQGENQDHNRVVVVEFVENGRVAIVRMQHTDNRFNPKFVKDFNSALDKVESKLTVQAMVTIGQGKFYSNGLDLENLPLLPPQELLKFSPDLYKLVGRLVVFPMITIAAINGHCYAMGAFLALAHDYRIMRNDRGWFCLPEIFLPRPIPMILMRLASSKLPLKEHVPCILLGTKYTGEEALTAGIVHKTASNAELMNTTLALFREKTSHLKEDLDRHTMSLLKHNLHRDIYEFSINPPIEPVSKL